jgi:hypothetical protein
VANVELSRRVAKAVAYTPLSDMSADQRRKFHEALLESEAFEDLDATGEALLRELRGVRAQLDRIEASVRRRASS